MTAASGLRRCDLIILTTRDNGVYYGCLVYADDVLLLSHSVQVMQNLLDICGSYAGDFDVKFNCVKSVAMRIGHRHNYVCAELILCGRPLTYVSSIKYLGTYISARTFTCTYEHVKLKFYRAFNALTVVAIAPTQKWSVLNS